MDANLKKPHLYVRNRYLLLADLILIVISVLVSFALKLELDNLFPYYRAIFVMVVISLAVKPVIYFSFGLYRRLWVYASVNELKIIVVAVSVASVIVSAIMILLFILGAFTGLPRSVLGIDFLLSLLFVGGVRFALRIRAESRAPQLKNGKTRKVLVVGAGDAGALVVRELQKNRQSNLEPVGFLDDDPGKLQHEIYGVPVKGTLNDLHEILEKDHVDEVIIAIPSAPGRVVRLVADVCRSKGIPFRTMPGIFELIGGKVSVSRLREVDITDLLRREPARVHEEWIGEALKGKSILVTGAGGSIGRELCRQITRWGPKRLITLGHGENSIFEALLELAENNPSLEVVPIIADVRDKQRIEAVLSQFRPEVIFHTAAHKHVPLMQMNTEEAVSNNVIGTRNLVRAAIESGVERFILISTDKAVRPVNVYGATKRLAEMIVLDAAQQTGKTYSVVRFGNVLGSRGSVVPIFKRQIAQGGPITLTHPDMERYFMTIPEAVHLVLQAAAMGKGGEAFLLNMGQQIRILDLAEDLIRLSGLEPGRDIDIVFTGIRPGEKLREDLWESDKTYEVTAHPEIFRSTEEAIPASDSLSEIIKKLEKSVTSNHPGEIIQLLDETIPGAAIKATPPVAGSDIGYLMPLVSLAEWDQFIFKHPDGHVLQTGEWGELKAAFGWQALRVVSGEAGVQLLLRSLPMGYTLAYLPKPISFDDNPLVEEVETLCRAKKSIMLKVEPDDWDSNPTNIAPSVEAFRISPHAIQPRRTIMVDISGSEEDILNRMKQKCRYNIRLAEKKGVTVRPWSDVKGFHDLIKLTGGRDGFGVHSLDYYDRVFKLFHPAGMAEMLVAEFDGKPLAALMVFSRGRRAWYLYGASSDEERNRMPAYLLQWEAMRWAKSKGAEEYDLWGVPDEDEITLESQFESRQDGLWGVYRFKRGFGGKILRAAPALDKVYNPLLYKLYLWRMTGREMG